MTPWALVSPWVQWARWWARAWWGRPWGSVQPDSGRDRGSYAPTCLCSFLQPTCQPRQRVGRRCGPGPLVAREGSCQVPPPLPALEAPPALRSPFPVTPWEPLCVAGSSHCPHCCLVLSVLLSVSRSVFYGSVFAHKRGLFLCAGLWGDWVKGAGVMWPRVGMGGFGLGVGGSRRTLIWGWRYAAVPFPATGAGGLAYLSWVGIASWPWSWAGGRAGRAPRHGQEGGRLEDAVCVCSAPRAPPSPAASRPPPALPPPLRTGWKREPGLLRGGSG